MKMQVFIFILLLFHAAEPFSIISDPSILRVLFGNISDMSDLYLAPLDEMSSDEENEPEEVEDDKLPNLDRYFTTIDDLLPKDGKPNMFTKDIEEFNTLSKSLKGFKIEPPETKNTPMRRGRFKVDNEQSGHHELEKKLLLIKNMMTFLVHTRFQCDMAIRQRSQSRHTKHYRLGYLFNRLRRIKYNQAKIIHEAFQQFKYIDKISKSDLAYRENIMMLLRWYQKIVHLDVDMRNIVELVEDVIEEREKKKPK